MAKKKIRMLHPDGEREWIADSDAEAHELMARGYTRVDADNAADPDTTPPTGGAKDAPRAGGKATASS